MLIFWRAYFRGEVLLSGTSDNKFFSWSLVEGGFLSFYFSVAEQQKKLRRAMTEFRDFSGRAYFRVITVFHYNCSRRNPEFYTKFTGVYRYRRTGVFRYSNLQEQEHRTNNNT